MKLNVKNTERVQAALEKVNNGAGISQHYFTVDGIRAVEQKVQASLGRFLSPPAMAGARGVSRSGKSRMDNGEASRVVNEISWILSVKGELCLTKIETVHTWENAGGTKIDLSEYQKSVITRYALLSVMVQK
jgi:hypothetical protein